MPGEWKIQIARGRDLDRAPHDLSFHASRLIHLSLDYWDTLKANHPVSSTVSVTRSPDSLQPEQGRKFDAVIYNRFMKVTAMTL
jgi:hypothetical protein